jgi:hypothetical protein
VSVPVELAYVESGAVLRLAAGEWSYGFGPAVTRMLLRVAKVHTDWAPEGPSGLWVSGHLPECPWGALEEHDPCAHVYVYLVPSVQGPAAGRTG